jgi:hypothetical protein
MADTDNYKPSDYFEPKPYSGNGGTLSVTGLEFQPDFSWLKCRGVAYHHRLYDVIRTPLDSLRSDSTSAESADGDGLSAFNSDGFTVTQGGNTEYNNNAVAYASWNWKAGGSASSNTDGSITSSVSANQDAGFSIGTYNGTGADNTVGHGLGVAPDMIIVKCKSTAHDWVVYHSALGSGKILTLNATTASQSATGWQNTDPTSTVFSIDNAANSLNQSGQSFVFYAMASKQGYSKFGSHTGNGSGTDGTFVYTGFLPSFIMFKSTSTTGGWEIHDNKRDTFNPSSKRLFPHLSNAEATEDYVDFVSNGFKFRTSDATGNTNGTSYIYMAFAENPFVTSSGVPATAR